MSLTSTQSRAWLQLTWLLVLLYLAALLLVIIFPTKAPTIVSAELPESPVDPQIRISFSETMDQKSVAENFTITPDVPGKVSWAGKMFVYTPDSNFLFDTDYTFSFGTDVRSKRGEHIAQPWEQKLSLPEHSFLFLDTAVGTGILKRHFVGSKKTETLSPKGYNIKNFDYDHTQDTIVVLAQKKGDDLFLPYLLDAETKNMQPIEKLHSSDFMIHNVKWIPFENALLLSRSAILNVDTSEFTHTGEKEMMVSPFPNDTVLLRHNLDDESVEIMRTGGALAYNFYPSPDGTRFVFIDDSGGLMMRSFSTDNEELITQKFEDHFGFSEYGGYLLYTVMTGETVFDDTNSLTLYSRDGERRELFGKHSFLVGAPSFSPDEQKLAFRYLDESRTQFRLAVSEIERDMRTNIITEEADGSIDQPIFSPDGRYIIFLQFSPERDPYDAKAGWDEVHGRLVGSDIMLYDTKTELIVETDLEGMGVEWLY